MSLSLSLEEKIVNKLKEYDVEVFKVDKQQNRETFIFAENMLISCKDNEILLNFHVSTLPNFSARITLLLSKIKNSKRIYIGDDFIFDKNGKYIDGEEATKLFFRNQEKEIIHDFIEDQKSLYLLSMADGYSC